MPSHATAQHNSEIRRRQLGGEQITAGDHSTFHAIPTIDNPASPAEFPLTAEQYAPPVSRFAPRTPAEAAAYEEESEARHAVDTPAAAVGADEEEEVEYEAEEESVDAE